MGERITLVDEMGEEHEFIIVATFGVNDEDYAALLPADNIESPTFILRMERDDNGDMLLLGIADDEELNDAIAVYEEIQKENYQ
ncbi:MAG: DUF1292 domain-containing protein [Tissierellaceae bacterium]|nr:DUF1292 domain-containing protein [Tissierellaceae bacterium]